MKKRLQLVSAAFAGLVLCVALAMPATARAGDEAAFGTALSMTDNLIAMKGKMVTVNLGGGVSHTGTVKDVKGNLLLLEKLVQKDFFDALVVIDRIASVEARVR